MMGAVAGSRVTAASSHSALNAACRSYHGFQFGGFHGWTLPYGATSTRVTKEELENQRYFTDNSRSKWDYNRIDENINSSSEFRRTEGREEFFQGMREDNSAIGSLHTPSKYRLYEYFDEYSKPGVDPKVAACYAVKEQWDASEFYYPGEAWRKNRPGFRSVPKELLNRQTWYHWSDNIKRWHEIQPTIRTRSWNPDWPPPGYHVPKLQCKKEFVFGMEEEGLVSEVERYNWYRSWIDNNLRVGWMEIPLYILLAVTLYCLARNAMSVTTWRAMMSNMYYPGRTAVRPFGVPKNWETDRFWWQRPLHDFPNQSQIWWMDKVRFGYINHIVQRDARERAIIEAEAAAQGGSAAVAH